MFPIRQPRSSALRTGAFVAIAAALAPSPAWAEDVAAEQAARGAGPAPVEAGNALSTARRNEARALIATGDLWGAREILEKDAAEHPDDCMARAWLAWLDMRQFLWDEAETRLDTEGCPTTDEERGRWALLRVLLAEGRGDPALARQRLQALDERAALFPEDDALDRSLRWRHSNNPTLPFEAMTEMGVGWTSDAFAGSPVDAVRRDNPSSIVGEPTGAVRLRAPERHLTPALELRGSAHAVGARKARERSHADIRLRAGAWLGRSSWRPFLAYVHEESLLKAAGSTRYVSAHRVEVELAPARGTLLVAGTGRRTFRVDGDRTRNEWDIAALTRATVAGTPVVLAASFRLFDAAQRVHDQVGATLTAGTEIPLGGRRALRLLAAGGLDDFPRSGGVEGLSAFGSSEKRRDVLARGSAGVWHRLSATVSIGATYEYAQRWSSADAVASRYYPYADHRVLVSLKVAGGGNPWRRGRAAPRDHVLLPYDGVEPAAVLLDDQVRRMLRHRDELVDDCGCQVR